jgi:polysaccharide pyruvyl transferase WcaK-like protein
MAQSPIHREVFKFDSYWTETIDFVNQHFPSAVVLCPNECESVFHKIHRYVETFITERINFDIVVLHKGFLHYVEIEFLKGIINTCIPIFGNSVFVVFSKDKLSGWESGPYLPRFAPVFDYAHRSGYPSEKKRSENVDLIFDPKGLNKNYISEQTALVYSRKIFANLKRSRRRINILVVSAAGMGNIGDDMILSVICGYFISVFPASTIKLSKEFYQADLVDWCDIIILGGGGIIYDEVFENVSNYMYYLLLASKKGKKIYSLFLGTQGLQTELGKHIYSEALRCSEIIVARSEIDGKLLSDLIGSSTPIIAAQDPVFIHPPVPIGMKAPHNFDLAISLRGFYDLGKFPALARYQNEMYSLLQTLSSALSVQLISHSNQDDEEFYTRLSSISQITNKGATWSPDEIISAYASSRTCITSRFHGIILSVLSRTPVIYIGNPEDKGGRLIATYLPSLTKYFFNIDTVSRFDVEECLNQLLAKPAYQQVSDAEVSHCVDLVRHGFSALDKTLASIK